MIKKCLVLCTILITFLSCSAKKSDNFSGLVKIALRDIGNQILLMQDDSTSVIKPVVAYSESKFGLSFSNDLGIEPNALSSIVKGRFEKLGLPNTYRVEVLNCKDREVAYSFQITPKDETTIIPCSGRYLPRGCYHIEVNFMTIVKQKGTVHYVLFGLGIAAIIIGIILFLRQRKKNSDSNLETSYTKIGSFQFYPEQNKLIKAATEINLSKKECEILSLFVSQPNQVITRDELTKRVWEDNGVFVGRSLDTYISKLRKKLQDDTSIKITNIHGIGYKLEI